MSLPELCLRRPVLAAVISLLIVAIGLVSAARLPVRELPDVDAAAVSIVTSYPGAAPEVVDAQVTEVIESAVSGLSGIDAISSASSRGRSSITLRFVIGRGIDEAANDVRGAVARVSDGLPDDAGEPRVTKNDDSSDPVVRVGVASSRHTPAEITDYVDRFLRDRLATLDGVANVSVFGDRRYAMRIALDPRAMAARRLTVADVAAALRGNNLELPAGQVVSVARQFQVRAATRLRTPDEFRAVVVGGTGDAAVRLGEIADVFVGAEDDSTILRIDGRPAVGLGVMRQAQANAIAISDAVRAEIAAIGPTLPEGMEVFVGSDDAIFIRASIREVLKTLAIAVALVVAVIFVFLGSPTATLIPAVTIPVALIGALAGIHAFGFSINILTLFALILAIGIVVDDAIVVLENIQKRVARGEAPIAAALAGSREVTFAVIATSVTLVSVFIPISFLQGQVGRLFAEFGIVLSIAVGFSTLVALTLCPVLCHRLLRKGAGGVMERAVNRAFLGVDAGYRRLLRGALGYPLVVVAVAAAIAGAAAWLRAEVPQELTPKEDRGVFFVTVTAPQGATIAYTEGEVRKLERILQPLVDDGTAARVFSIIGFRNLTHRAFIVVRLANWGERENALKVIAGLIGPVTGVPGVRAFPFGPSGLGLRGSRTPLQVKVLGPDFASVQAWSGELKEALRDDPRLINIDSDYERTQPELRVSIDRALADDLGVSIADLGATLQTFFAGREVTEWLDRGREYPVIVQAGEEARRSAADLDGLYVRRAGGGRLIPLSALVSVEETTASPQLNRFRRLPAIEVSAGLAEGQSLGRAIEDARAAAARLLPPEAQIAFDGQAREFLATAGGAALTFAFALVIVYLVLAAQFESFVDPVVIMLAVPLSITGALGTIWWMDQSLNIYTQIGMVLLLGLMAKNGILIVEFANQLRDRGFSVREAALEGAVQRLRPVLMTVVSTLLGALPLVLSSGAGAEARAAIGTVIIGGFGFASVLTLFLTPVLYDLLARFTRPRGAAAAEIEAALGAGAAGGRDVAPCAGPAPAPNLFSDRLGDAGAARARAEGATAPETLRQKDQPDPNDTLWREARTRPPKG